MMYSSAVPSRPQPGRRKIPSRNRGVVVTSSGGFPLTFVIAAGMAVLMMIYLGGMLLLANTTGKKQKHQGGGSSNNVNSIGINAGYNKLRSSVQSIPKPPTDSNNDEGGGEEDRHDNNEDEDNNEHIVNKFSNNDNNNNQDHPSSGGDGGDARRMLKAYVEPIDQSVWETMPLPLRTTTSEDLKVIEYPALKSCSRLPEQWPVDDYPDDDPFLPWIHDVFPSHDGTHIQFVAQNKRRCKTGTTQKEINITKQMAPQVALFQHVAVKRVPGGGQQQQEDEDKIRYQLVPHEDADEDGMDARFICRFSNGEETLSVYNFSYEWASYRKHGKKMFREDGRDNKQIHTSQLLFKCPVPEELVETIRTGSSVVNDYATIFVDLIPLRTPPRYGPPNEFFPPYYKEFQLKPQEDSFDPSVAWGDNQIMPKIKDSGRWENIPICKPSLLEYGKQQDDNAVLAPASATEKVPYKANKLVSCLWASAGYATRGERFAINDGQRRLLEWVTYNKLIGVEHFYLYDNSGAHTSDTSLQPIADMFPDDITVIKWPSKVCNNNKNNVVRIVTSLLHFPYLGCEFHFVLFWIAGGVDILTLILLFVFSATAQDSVGERSSQYAAEASCRLRFGPHTEWVAQVSSVRLNRFLCK
jgi:Glycosyltransferase family 92